MSGLVGVGYYASPPGGAPRPAVIGHGLMLFELIVAGRVQAPGEGPFRGPGWVFGHRAGQETIWRSPPDEHYECLTLHFDSARAHPPEDWPRAFFWGDEAAAVLFAHEMLKAFHHTDVPRDILGHLIWSQLRFRLDSFRRHEERREIPPRISAVMSLIERHCGRELTIAELARQAGLGPSHLHAEFKAHVNRTPHQYLIEQRMKLARQALVQSADPIKAIARSVGYVNTENFCRAFKRHFGATAASYRKQYTIYGNR
jgi:AraC-like DNA-binding protein